MANPVTMIDAIIQSKEIFHRNADTLVAGFLIRHPDVDPADVELVMTPMTGGALRFTIEPKELHVPRAKEGGVPDLEGWDQGHAMGLIEGWNECRDAMIEQKKSARSEDALVATLKSMMGDGNG